MIHFSFSMDKKVVLVELLNSMKTDTVIFNNFKNICEAMSARYNADYGTNTVSIDYATELIEAFLGHKFHCTISDDLKQAIYDMASQIENDIKDIHNTLEKKEKVLMKKGKSFFPFQKNGIEWLAPRRKAALFDEMGLGKTIQSLMTIRPEEGTVVICPSIAKSVWYKEARKWRPKLVPYFFVGRGSFIHWPKPGQIYIVNYDILPGSPPPNCPKNIRLIFDEAHAVKNIAAKRTKFSRQIADAVDSAGGRTIILTGSPLPNRPSELWTVLETCGLATQAYGNWKNFWRVYNGSRVGGKFVWGTPEPEAATLLKRVALIRKRADVLQDLPEKIYQDIDVEVNDPAVKAALDEIRDALEDSGVEIDDVSLEEIQANEMVFSKLARVRAQLARIKIPFMLEYVEQYEESDEPLVVFSAHKAPIEVLSSREGWAVITGDVSHEARSKIVDDFQAGKYKGLGITIQSGGVGITLTHAAHSLFVDKMWTPALNWQAEDRLCRIGQTRGVNIISLVCNHVVEQHVHNLLSHKTNIIETSVDRAKVSGDMDMVSYNMKTDILDKMGGNISTKKLEKMKQMISQIEIAAPVNAPRDARTLIEKWAKDSITSLALSNKFSKFDEISGKDLANKIAASGLTDTQWRTAINMSRKYQKEIGAAPEM